MFIRMIIVVLYLLCIMYLMVTTVRMVSLLNITFVKFCVEVIFVCKVIILIRFLKIGRVVWCLLVENICIVMCVNMWLIDFFTKKNIICIIVVKFFCDFCGVYEEKPCYMKPTSCGSKDNSVCFFYIETKTDSCTKHVMPFFLCCL